MSVKRFTITLSEEHYQKLKNLAQKEDRPMSKLAAIYLNKRIDLETQNEASNE